MNKVASMAVSARPMAGRTGLDRAALHSSAQGSPESRRAGLREVAREFEAVLMQQMVTAMRQTVGESGLVAKGQGEKVFESMLDEQWARRLAAGGGPSSLSEMLYRQLCRQSGLAPEVAPGPSLGAPAALPAPTTGKGEGNGDDD
jgi:flagellar protein FlgJ